MLLEDGSLMAMARLRGQPHELCLAADRNAAAMMLNRLYCDLSDDSITLGFHLVRENVDLDLYQPRFRNGFSASFWKAYVEHLLADKLYSNEWYFSLILSPRILPVATRAMQRKVARRMFQYRKDSGLGLVREQDLEEIWAHVARSLAVYDVERLGWRWQGVGDYRYRFTEIGEALRRILGYGGKAPMLAGRISNSIYTDADRPVFERQIYRILPPGSDDESDDAPGVRWGQIFCLNDNIETTHPDVLDELLSRPYPLVMSIHYGFYNRMSAVDGLRGHRKRMKASDDQAKGQHKKLKKATSAIADGDLGWAESNFSLAVYAPTYPALLGNCADARSVLVNTGAVVVPESDANMDAYFAQVPGNPDKWSAPGRLSTQSLADMASFGAFPVGERKGRWGNGIPLPTTARTVYWYTPHVGEIGMTFVVGSSGGGKTAFTNARIALADQYFVEKPGIVIVHDADRGSENFIEAIGGKYLHPEVGEDSGFAPLLGFKENTPYARSCLHRIFRDCILRDGLGPYPPEDNARMDRMVRAMLDLPPRERSMARGRLFLGWDNPMGAGPRFEQWCRSDGSRPDGPLAWILDNRKCRVDFSGPAAGFNLGPLLEMPEAVEPIAEYIRCRMEPLFGKLRVWLVFEEAASYMTVVGFARRIQKFLQRARKLGVIMDIIAQQAEDMLRGTLGPAIVGQCQTMIVFPSPQANENVFCGEAGLKFTRGEYHAVTTRMRASHHEVLIRRQGTQEGAGAQSVIVQMDLSPLPAWYMNVLSGRASTTQLKDKLQNKMPQWLEEFAVLSPELVE
jgi:type IV secretion system protein VirB4